MASITKLKLINNIAAKTGIHKVDVLTVVEAYIKEIKTSVLRGDKVALSGFCTYGLKLKPARRAYNMYAKKHIYVPERYHPYFKPSPELVRVVRKTVIPEKKFK